MGAAALLPAAHKPESEEARTGRPEVQGDTEAAPDLPSVVGYMREADGSKVDML